MRLWSLHPCYLDSQGLVALWREGLLALEVLRGHTRGYRSHPQLVRFKSAASPIQSIKCYLRHVLSESVARGYHFDGTKLGRVADCPPLQVTRGQLAYELEHLKKKLATRNPERYAAVKRLERPRPHPMFVPVPGEVEDWERTRGGDED